MREVIIINENYLLPDTYKYFNKAVMARRFWLFNKKVGSEPHIKLKKLGQKIKIASQKWHYTRMLAQRKYPIILYNNAAGEYEPVSIDREDGEYTAEILNTDLWRDFKKGLVMKNNLTTSLWQRLSKLLTLSLFAILAIAVIIVGIVLVNKFAIDHTAILQGTQLQGNNFLNNTITKVIG